MPFSGINTIPFKIQNALFIRQIKYLNRSVIPIYKKDYSS